MISFVRNFFLILIFFIFLLLVLSDTSWGSQPQCSDLFEQEKPAISIAHFQLNPEDEIHMHHIDLIRKNLRISRDGNLQKADFDESLRFFQIYSELQVMSSFQYYIRIGLQIADVANDLALDEFLKIPSLIIIKEHAFIAETIAKKSLGKSKKYEEALDKLYEYIDEYRLGSRSSIFSELSAKTKRDRIEVLLFTDAQYLNLRDKDAINLAELLAKNEAPIDKQKTKKVVEEFYKEHKLF